MTSLHLDRRATRGMTLIELVVAMLVVSILAAVAIPSYRGYVRRVNRTEAKVALNDYAQRLQRCYTRNNVYDDASCTLTGLPAMTDGGHYQVSAEIAAQTYTLTATPQGAQASDTDCGNFTLDHLGTQGVSAGDSQAAQCWQR